MLVSAAELEAMGELEIFAPQRARLRFFMRVLRFSKDSLFYGHNPHFPFRHYNFNKHIVKKVQTFLLIRTILDECDGPKECEGARM